MKIKKISLFVGVALVTIGLSACGNNKPGINTADVKSTEKKQKYINQENTDAVIKALNSKKPKFKATTDGWEAELRCVVIDDIYNDFGTDGVYGFDDPNSGTSVEAFAIKNNLNREQSSAIRSLTYGTDEETGVTSNLIWNLYPASSKDAGTEKDRFPYQGADVDYVEISDLKTAPSKYKDSELEITAKVTYYLHLLDGTKVKHEFTSNKIPDVGNTEFCEETKQRVLHAQHMNEPLRLDREGYVPFK
ncbi:hypothetical protein AAK913_12550 [Enterococcus faecium]|uniref:hypothetical protein n=1 Tax=Enterococcus faecium TaxID=1352 RepID=UPI003519ADD0